VYVRRRPSSVAPTVVKTVVTCGPPSHEFRATDEWQVAGQK
jgi:hypothetical protein